MKITAKLTLLAGALGIAYLASSWVLGQQVEKATDDLYAHMEMGALVKIVERDFQRGILSSTDKVTLEVFGGLPSEDGVATPSTRVTFVTEFRHGPLLGGTQLGAAVSDTEMILDAELRKQFSNVAGQQPLFVARTHHRFDGGGTSTMSIPSFSMALDADDDDTPGVLSSGGASLVLDFQPGLASYSYRGNAPLIEVKGGEGGHLVMSGLSLNGDLLRVFDDNDLLYYGVEKLAVDQLKFSNDEEAGNTLQLGKVQIGGLVVDPDMPTDVGLADYIGKLIANPDMSTDGEFVDYIARAGAEVVQVGTKDYGPAHYDFSFRHLHARTLAGLFRSMLDVYGDEERMKQVGSNPSLFFEPFAEAGQALLKYQPEFRIERISFNSPQGEARLSGSARLGDVSDEMLANPAMLMEKLEADADIVIPEILLKALAADNGDDGAAMVEQQLTALADEGYVVRNQGMVGSKMVLRGGEMTANGKPFSPMMGASE